MLLRRNTATTTKEKKKGMVETRVAQSAGGPSSAGGWSADQHASSAYVSLKKSAQFPVKTTKRDVAASGM